MVWSWLCDIYWKSHVQKIFTFDDSCILSFSPNQKYFIKIYFQNRMKWKILLPNFVYGKCLSIKAKINFYRICFHAYLHTVDQDRARNIYIIQDIEILRNITWYMKTQHTWYIWTNIFRHMQMTLDFKEGFFFNFHFRFGKYISKVPPTMSQTLSPSSSVTGPPLSQEAFDYLWHSLDACTDHG